MSEVKEVSIDDILEKMKKNKYNTDYHLEVEVVQE